MSETMDSGSGEVNPLETRRSRRRSNGRRSSTSEETVSEEKPAPEPPKEKAEIANPYRRPRRKPKDFTPEEKKAEEMPRILKGKKSAFVKVLQESLNKHGYTVAVDGIYSQQTFVAVRKFQEDKGTQVDGIVGLDTWTHLLSKPKATERPSDEVKASGDLLS